MAERVVANKLGNYTAQGLMPWVVLEVYFCALHRFEGRIWRVGTVGFKVEQCYGCWHDFWAEGAD